VDAEDAQTPISDEGILHCQENVRNVKDFMMSLSALQYVQLLYSDDEHVETEETLLSRQAFCTTTETVS
jgi:hypothetical protein